MSSSDTARIGVVGLGGMGTHHSNCFRDLGHEIVAGADITDNARRSFAEEFTVDTYQDYETMYDTEPIDGVVVTTPHAFHAPPAIAALERDINVLVEKPLAHNVEAAEAVFTAERNSTAFGMVGFCRRFSTGDTLFKALQEEGRFGDLRHAEIYNVRQRGIPELGSWFTQEELAGGGAVVDAGVHGIDRALHLLDFPDVLEVSAVTRSDFGTRGEDYVDPDGWGITDPDSFTVEDSASVFIRCTENKTISLEIAWATNRVEPTHQHIVWGTKAGATLSGDGLTLISADDTGIDHRIKADLRGEREYTHHKAQAKLFAESIHENKSPDMNTIEQGVAVQRVVGGIYRSDDKNRAVRIES